MCSKLRQGSFRHNGKKICINKISKRRAVPFHALIWFVLGHQLCAAACVGKKRKKKGRKMHEKGVNLTVALELCVLGKVGCTNISRTRCLSSTCIVLVQYIAGCNCVSASVCTLQREKNMQRSLYIRLQNISIWRPLSVHDANILLYMLRSWKRCNDCAWPP